MPPAGPVRGAQSVGVKSVTSDEPPEPKSLDIGGVRTAPLLRDAGYVRVKDAAYVLVPAWPRLLAAAVP